MTRRIVWTSLALVGGLATAGCQAAPPSGTPGGAARTPAPVLGAERSIQALDQAGFERMMSALPKQLTNEQAARMLVKLPVGAPQITTGTRFGYRISAGEAGAMDYGNGQAGAMSNGDDKDRGASMGNGHDKVQEQGHEEAKEEVKEEPHEEVHEVVHEQPAVVLAPPNLDYRFFSVGGATVPYVSYYPYVYNFSNSHWAPYAAYVSGRYYYPYYQGYGSLYAPYSYSQIMPYGGVYAMRTGTILR